MYIKFTKVITNKIHPSLNDKHKTSSMCFLNSYTSRNKYSTLSTPVLVYMWLPPTLYTGVPLGGYYQYYLLSYYPGLHSDENSPA